MLSSGIAELDAITDGIPCGCITVICGAASSGKTSALLAALAKNTQNEGNCVLIDASDSFDPKSAAAAGVNFNRLLWARCGGPQAPDGHRSSAIRSFANDQRPLLACPEQSEGTIDGEPRAKSRERTTNDGSTHDARRMTRDEQPRAESQQPRANDRRLTTASELRLDQVLKTTDLILQSGGFGLVVLDLGGIPEKFVRRIPLASWFRFQRAVEHTKTALLVISEFSCAQTCAALVLELKLSVLSSQLSVASRSCSRLCSDLSPPTHAELFQQMHVEAELVRSRMERKPVQSVAAHFITKTMCAG
jgi:hypothetical protein